MDPSPITRHEEQSAAEDSTSTLDSKAQEKAERKAAKKLAAAEKAAERQKIAQEKAAVRAAERAKMAQEKAIEKEKAAALKEKQEKAQKDKAEKERAEKAERDREIALKAEKEKEKALQLEKVAQAEREKAQEKKASSGKSKSVDEKVTKRPDSTKSSSRPTNAAKSSTPAAVVDYVSQVPLLSKKPKKSKSAPKPTKVAKEGESIPEDASTISDGVHLPSTKASTATSSSSNSRAHSVDIPCEPSTVEDLLDDIHVFNPSMDMTNHPFFDMSRINPAAKMPLEYGPLVHALSALSVGGGSFANNTPVGSIDNAVSSFQQLLETLTQTISDLLRLLPRTTWDDSSSFDGVLRDMLKGDDFLDEGGDDNPGKEDEVAALTLALERRARWMEVQLSKLEELHRDINTAAVRAVLSFNDNGWDRHGFLPRVGNTLRRFDVIGTIEENGSARAMTADELEKKLLVAKEAAAFAETEVREIMGKMQTIRPIDEEM